MFAVAGCQIAPPVRALHCNRRTPAVKDSSSSAAAHCRLHRPRPPTVACPLDHPNERPKTPPQSIKLEDNVPRVQPTPQSIDYEVAPQSNLLQYVDHAGYKTELGSEVEVSRSYLSYLSST